MTNQVLDALEPGLSPIVRQAVHDFVAALTDTPQYAILERASDAVQRDETARHAIEAYQTKQQALRAMIVLNAVSAEDQAELERLHQAVFTNPTVTALVQAQNEFRILCQTTANLLSEQIGLNFAVAGGSCCG